MTRRVADRYLLGEQLGAGGTSRVHAALDERLGRQVAIKLLDAALVASADPAGRERFLREGPTSASFNHRNAVTVFDAGEDAGDLYIVMELVEGPSLAEHLARTGALPVDEAIGIARQVLAALAAAHAMGIVHRDVKPANVLLDPNGEVKLADFGIAKRFDNLEESVTTSGTVIGTPRYLAPEQAMGERVTAATDIYAVGILLFEMLTGHAPFAGLSLAGISVLKQSQAAPDVRSLRPEVAEQLSATVARALAINPADRYPTALEMAAALAGTASSPADVVSASAVATQLMQVADPVAVGERSGDTQIMPSNRRVSKASVAMVALVALVGIVAASALLSARDGSDGVAVAEIAATAASDTAGQETLPSSLPPLAEEPASTSSPVADIIPGFPWTDDLEVFLLQLEADPTLVGEAGEDLARELRDVFDERSRKKQRDMAKDLQEQLIDWVDDEKLHPAIAEELDLVLEEFRD